MSHPTVNAETLLAAWQASGALAPDAATRVGTAIQADAAQDRPPLHLKILSAVGTLLATGFFFAFLAVADLISFDSGSNVLSWGVAFLAVGIGLTLALPRAAAGIGREVLGQVAFTAMALGKVMSVAGIILLDHGNTHWLPTAAILAVTLATYPVSGSSLDRTLSPYAVAVAALVEILHRGGAAPSLAVTALFTAATVVAGLLLLSRRAPLALRPVGIAALGAMGTIVSILASGVDVGLWASRAPLDPRLIEAVLTLSLVGAIAWAAGGIDRLSRPALAAATAGVVLLGLAGTPGIGFALLVLIVGHALHDVPLRVVGILALPVFLVLWYYGRDLTLLEKSATLVGSGALLLAGRLVMARAGWDRETAP